MSTFEQVQRKSNTSSTRGAPTSRHLLSSRSFAPTAVPTSEQASSDSQAQPQHGPHLSYSLAHIPIFPPHRENHTGLPDSLKARIENLSGMSLGDVKVHYNSSRPAAVHALAYTQGTNIHVGPEQKQHLPHEAWHVVQQKQGRVKPRMQAKGMAVNDDQELEREADDIGQKVASSGESQNLVSTNVMSERTVSALVDNVIQRVKGKGNKRTKLAEEEEEEEEEEEPVRSKGRKKQGKKRTRKGSHLPEPAEEEPEIAEDILTVINNPEATLAERAAAIHKAGKGSPNASTTGVGELSDGTVVLATQLSPNNTELKLVAGKFGIEEAHIHKTLGAGFHVETTLYINYPNLQKVGASQGFCPDCQLFLKAKGITADGPNRTTPDQVWHSPEYHMKTEKNPIAAPYPYTRQKDAAVSNNQILYKTKAEYEAVQAAQVVAKRKTFYVKI